MHSSVVVVVRRFHEGFAANPIDCSHVACGACGLCNHDVPFCFVAEDGLNLLLLPRSFVLGGLIFFFFFGSPKEFFQCRRFRVFEAFMGDMFTVSKERGDEEAQEEDEEEEDEEEEEEEEREEDDGGDEYGDDDDGERRPMGGFMFGNVDDAGDLDEEYFDQVHFLLPGV